MLGGLAVDGNGVAAVIAASVAGVVSLGTLYMQIMSWKDARRLRSKAIEIEAKGDLRAQKIDHLATQVNGRLSELKIRIAKEAFEMGRKFEQTHGADAVSPEFPKPKVEELMEMIKEAEKGGGQAIG